MAVVVTGEQKGRSAFLEQFCSQNKHKVRGSIPWSVYTEKNLKEIGGRVKQISEGFEREAIQLALEDDQDLPKFWYQTKINSKTIFIENVALPLWTKTLTHLRYLSSCSTISIN